MEVVTKTNQGYKKTKIGWIPEDWNITSIGKLTNTTAGGTPSTRKKEYWNGNIRWMSSGDLNKKKVFDVDGRITELGLNNSSTKLIPTKSILIGLAGQGKTRGTVAMNYIELCTNQSVAAILPSNSYYADFLYYNLDSRYLEIRNMSVGDGGRGGLNLKIVNSIKVPLPPLPEQQKIAQILSTWDKAIEQTQKLIEQLKNRKKGLMQQLLTGKTRLKGFSGEWKEVKLGDVFGEITQKNDGRNHEPLTISAKIGFVSQRAKFDRVIAGGSLDKYTQLQKNDFSYNKGNSKTYPMGCIFLLEDYESAVVPFVYISFRANDSNVHNHFYKHWFANHGLDRQLKAIITSGARGDGLLNVNKKDFFSLKIPLPVFEEQQAVAKVLTIADKEIKTQESYLQQLQDQKKGLMQQLLTGQKRVNVNN